MPRSQRASRDEIGWTSPTIIYDKMRQIESAAQDLGPKIETHVANDPAFVRAWEAWDKRWTEFYQKYQTDTAKAGAIFYTDDLDRQTEAFRKEFLGFYDAYPTKLQASGQPVPRPAVPPPLPGERPPRERDRDDRDGWSLPWWAWVGGTLALVGLGYWGYRRYVELTETKRSIQTNVLPGLIGPNLAAAARDPSSVRSMAISERGGAGGWPKASRSEETTRGERLLSYRPYAHPHLVPVEASHELLVVAGDRKR